MRETWSDRWFRWTGTETFFWGTGACALALVARMVWPLTWSTLDLMLVFLIAWVVWPVLVILVIGPAGAVVAVLCACLDVVAGWRRPHRRRATP